MSDQSALEAVNAALDRIAERNAELNAFTVVMADRARATAAALDASRATGRPRLPLEGVPFAVKNLFDVAGLATVAGSRINRSRPVASSDATLVRRMEAAGAVLIGTLNMGEYAYDFTGENIHDGPSRNPHDLTRMSGGSSGGSGSAVGGALVPIALGSDTNGSIRVPSSFCGIFGLKPTFGRLSRAGSFPFVASLDHLGPFARNVTDLALAYDAMQGQDVADPFCAERMIEPVSDRLSKGNAGLRVRILGGYFRRGATKQAIDAVSAAAGFLGASGEVELPEVARARAAAYVITATEGAALHLERLRSCPGEFDPAVRDRLIAGALIPAPFVARAQKFRRWYRDAVLPMFDHADILIAPATPFPAPRLGQSTMTIDGETVPLRPNIGIYTQPISFIGLPVVAAPIDLVDQELPIAVQLIAAPWREDLALRAAWHLEQAGIARAR